MHNEALAFLKNLQINNNKIWFEAHRNEYNSARNVLLTLVQGLITGIQHFDPTIGHLDAKKCLFRQNRDVRFSKNKDPYKTNMGAYIAKGGKNNELAGYYIHFEPNNSFVGGGLYAPQPNMLHAVRNEIYFNAEEFLSIINNAVFVKTFGSLMNEKLVRPPKGFPPDFNAIDLLKYKHYAVSCSFAAEEMSITEIQSFALDVFKQMQPLIQFIHRGQMQLENGAADN